MQRDECMSVGGGSRDKALARLLAEEINLNKPLMKSSNGGSKNTKDL
jgi:phosphoribosylamine-glycine ligase